MTENFYRPVGRLWNYEIGALHLERKRLIFKLRHVVLHFLKQQLTKIGTTSLGMLLFCVWATSRYNVNFTREEDVLEGEEEESAGGKGAVSVQLFLVFVVVLLGG